MLPIQTILYPTDFSSSSTYAFRLACSLARDYGARLTVLHVLEQPPLAYPGVMMAPPPPEPSAETRQACLDKLHQVKPAEPGIPVDHLLVTGDPSVAILQIAQDRHCDLIIMGTHGRTGVSRLLMGSVAEKVLRKAPCPVLTVKVPSADPAARARTPT
jgi:nucleotide-binding universal stress UspA family protein